jgi:hypothetical protein
MVGVFGVLEVQIELLGTQEGAAYVLTTRGVK